MDRLRFGWLAAVSGVRWLMGVLSTVGTIITALVLVAGLVISHRLLDLPLWAVVLIAAAVFILVFFEGSYRIQRELQPVSWPSFKALNVQLRRGGELFAAPIANDGLDEADQLIDAWIAETAAALRADAPEWEAQFLADTALGVSRKTVYSMSELPGIYADLRNERKDRIHRHVERLREIIGKVLEDSRATSS